MFELSRLGPLTIASAFAVNLAFFTPRISATLPAVPAPAISLRTRNRTIITNPTTITKTFTFFHQTVQQLCHRSG
jgi:hypothetical protein